MLPKRTRIRVGGTLLWGVLLALAAVDPALAAESGGSGPVCSTDRLPSMVEGFFQLTTGVGLLGLAVVWQADSLAELFTISRDGKEQLRRHKRGALRSTLVLVLLGPLYTVAGSVMNLPLAACVDLVPW